MLIFVSNIWGALQLWLSFSIEGCASMWNILYTEWCSAVKGKFSYTFSLLWITMFSLLFIIERNNAALAGYTNATGTMENGVFYVRILFILLPI